MPRVLVLEDDDDLREVLVEVLEDQGHEALGVARGEAAIETFLQQRFDLLVSDIRMAGPDGLETIGYLRKLGYSVPIIIMTGFADQNAPIRALKLGVQEYLIKPFAMEEFLWAAERILERVVEEQRQNSQRQELQEALQHTLAHAFQQDPEGYQQIRQLCQLLGLSGFEEAMMQLCLCWKPGPAPNPPTPVARVLAAWGQPPLSDQPQLSRLGTLFDHLHWPLDHKALTQLQREAGGRIDPYLLEKLALALKTQQQLKSPSAQLFELAHILLACGDRSGAARAFRRQIEALPQPCGERIQARVGLTSCLRDQDAPEVRAQTFELIRDLGELPAPQAVDALWKSASWLLGLDPLQLLPVLQSLAGESEALQSKLSLAQCTLLRACLEGGQLPWLSSALAHLMLPEHRRPLQEAMDWLLPRLMVLGSESAELKALLVRLCRQERPLLAQLLRQQQIDEVGRIFLLEALEGWSHSGQECLAFLAEDPSPRVRERARNLQAGRDEKQDRIPVQVTTFGGFEMWVAHQKIADSAWRGSRVKHLAAYLAISPRPVHQERLLELFWPDQLERGQRGLSSALSVIRGSCRDFAELQGKSLLVREAECVLIPDDFQRWVDCQEFSRLIRQADQAEDAEARSALLQRAVSLYAGPFLEGCFFDWALQLQGEYETLALQAMLQLSGLELEQRRWLSALQTAQRALRIDPLQLQAAGTILKAHIGGGHTEQALQFFQGFQLRYEEELGQSLSFDQALAASSSS